MNRLLVLAVCSAVFRSFGAELTGPLRPAEALSAFQLEPGLRIELVASEPLVVDPVAMAFDEKGRLYVAENRGYPTGPGKGKPPAGIVALLEDTDADGRYDKRTVLAEGLTFPNGIMPWRGGVLVTCAPDIFYLKDTDGDGRAHEKHVILTGFDASNTTQLRVSHPTLGPDNWIYVTSGLTGAKIVKPGATRAPLETHTDVRFRPDTWDFEASDGRGQFGLTFDDFGHRFVCMNRVQVQHVVASGKYWQRNPAFHFNETVQNVPETVVPEPLPGHLAAARIYPISHNITTADSHAGTFTAACGVMIYRGNALPDEYYGNAFSCDPTGNLVHRDSLETAGATFSASRVTPQREAVASTDDWFRPVFLTHGPDGALYICDMYRKTIEHPQYLPGEVRQHTDFESGKDKGRIYRLIGTSHVRAANNLDLSRASVPELCALLSHPNGWHRDTAHRLLLEKADSSMVAPLKQMFVAQTASSPAGRVFALHLLTQSSALDEPTLLRALEDFHPGVRENAVMLAARRLQSSAMIRDVLLDLADDPDPHVGFQCALAIGDLPGKAPAEPLAHIALAGVSDKWTRAAALSSIAGREIDFARACAQTLPRFTSVRSIPAGVVALSQELGRLLGATLATNDLHQAVKELLGTPPPTGVAPWQIAFASGFLGAIEKRNGPSISDLFPAFGQATTNSSPRPPRAELLIAAEERARAGLPPERPSNNATQRRDFLKVAEARSRTLCTDKGALVELRQAAVELLARLRTTDDKLTILRLLDPAQPSALQATAVRALLQTKDETDAAELLRTERWNRFTPAVRETVLEAMLSNPRHVPELLGAIESGTLPSGVVNSARRKQLLQNRDESIRQRAAALFKNASSTDRMKVFEEYKSVLSLKAAPANGREVFKKNCSTCHRLDREGVPVGPDLFSMREQSKETILLHIIVPEYEILPGFVNYFVETKNGSSLSGIIAAESPQSITLRKALNEEETIARSNIVSIVSSGLSLMPQELEKTMTRQEMADLLGYLKGEQ